MKYLFSHCKVRCVFIEVNNGSFCTIFTFRTFSELNAVDERVHDFKAVDARPVGGESTSNFAAEARGSGAIIVHAEVGDGLGD